MARNPPTSLDWTVSAAPVDYPAAVAAMEARVAAIRAGRAPEQVWLLEHPPIYTAGTGASPAELLDAGAFPIYATGRGGRYTYHGPGQRIAYVMLDLRRRRRDLRAFVRGLEQWVIAALARFGVGGERRPGRVGIWIDRGGGREAKIAAVGVRVRHWITFHGVSINVAPDLGHYAGIVPCGVAAHGVTSLADLGVAASMEELDGALEATFETVFAAATAREPAA